ncbi:sigma-70 family RNA polymerase sigma factor [Fulvivirga sp. 29W222]|uniref:Sigma-70 family RNA polymerase sigma factor n=1 Tax=Fulvivirga marina TaxID=2494733 RepID=A0A937FZC0_9BACT|nr:sigma-70 family RNA polymerase sigma factor [Fulvivirga marina]MBL6447787.1 sigma-70 family RNA polymerase sigma factor [Fulvivirga marina]
MTQQQQNNIFEDWLARYKGMFFKVVRVYAFTPADQDDLFQEIAVQIWRSVPSFREESSAGTWIYRIALNTAMKWIRKEQKHREGQPYEHLEHLLTTNESLVDDRLEWLYEEIAHMNEADRAITLLLLDGFSYKEMSDILGISENHIGVKIHRIKKHLITKSKNYDHHGV